MSFEFFIPTRIKFGADSLSGFNGNAILGKRALLVTSCGSSAKACGALDAVYAAAKECGAEIFLYNKITPNPTLDEVNEGARFARLNLCDCVVAVGGGSVIDASKAIAVTATNGENYWDYVRAGTGGGKPLENSPLPLTAITTTAGTGSEADATAVVTNAQTHEKIGFVHPGMFPALSFVDSSLTLKIPPHLTAYQGFDALFHATECYISGRANMMSDMYALTSAKYVGKYLARAVKRGEDKEAREGMSFANMLSGMVMTLSGCTAKHGMEHAMSAKSPSLPHGAGLIMLALEYYAFEIERGACDERFIELARALGAEKAEKPQDFLTALKNLMTECGVAELKMSDYGITKGDFGAMADISMSSMKRVFENDRISLTREDVIGIYSRSYR